MMIMMDIRLLTKFPQHGDGSLTYIFSYLCIGSLVLVLRAYSTQNNGICMSLLGCNLYVLTILSGA